MKIIEFVKESQSNYPKHSIVRVGFVNREGDEDETELHVCQNVYSEEGKQELEELWKSLAGEMNAEVDAVTYVDIVDSADFPFWQDTFSKGNFLTLTNMMEKNSSTNRKNIILK